MSLGGILAVAWNVNQVLICLGVGAATPAVVSALIAAIKR